MQGFFFEFVFINFLLYLTRTKFIKHQMTALSECIAKPHVNVFDIINLQNGKYTVYTYLKPNESEADFTLRHQRNLRKAEQLKKTKPAC
jgi:hypothetical protein